MCAGGEVTPRGKKSIRKETVLFIYSTPPFYYPHALNTIKEQKLIY